MPASQIRHGWHSVPMPESAEEVYARVVAAVGEDGRLPAPPLADWDIFPWEVVDGAIAPKVLPPPADEKPRAGESGKPCPTCDRDPALDIWENERWIVTGMKQPAGLPLALFLQTKEHLDFTDMDDDLAAEYGRITVWLTRIMSHLPNIGRVHVNRWGDGSATCTSGSWRGPSGWPACSARTPRSGTTSCRPTPEEVWRADLATIAHKLANHDGRARV